MITTTSEWFKPDEKIPGEDGEYLVILSLVPQLEVVRFATNLRELDDIDFPGEEYARPGFYEMGGNYRYEEIDTEHILYWTKVPEIEEAKA